VPVFRWADAGPVVTLALGGQDAVYVPRHSMLNYWPENSLYPALVAQLLAVLLAGDPLGACSRCGRLHEREKKARSDQPAYCDRCRASAERDRKARWAAKNRAAKRRQPSA
jgi:hypothetical protein